MSATRVETVIVGAGILGLATARSLVAAGGHGSSILVLDSGSPGGGTTGRGAGFVSVHLWDQDDIRLVVRTRELLREVAESSGGRFAYHRTGMLTVVNDGEDVRWLSEMLRMAKLAGAPGEMLWPADLEARFPAVRRDDLVAAAWTPDDGYAVAGDCCAVLANDLVRQGVEIRGDTPIAKITIDGHEAKGVRIGPGEGTDLLEAERVVLAAGCWTRKLLQRSGLDAPLAPYRTQAAILRAPGGELLPTIHDAVADVCVRPAGPGLVLAGDGAETKEFDPETYSKEGDPAFVGSIQRAFAHRFPAHRSESVVRAWAGLTTATPDRHPLMGPHPACANLHLLAGDNGFGFMRGLALGELLAKGILAGTLPPVVRRYAASRFADWDGRPFPIRQGFSRTVTPEKAQIPQRKA